MDIRLFPEQQKDKNPDTVCHVLPCHIHYTGPANVAEYFTIEGDQDVAVKVTQGVKFDENEKARAVDDDIDEQVAIANKATEENESSLDAEQELKKSTHNVESSGPLNTHFRGRKLHGIEQKLPENYSGYRFSEGQHIYEDSSTVGQLADLTQDFDEDGFERNPDDYRQNEPVELRTWDAIGKFDKLVIWGHERVPDAASDQWACGVRDWAVVADAMNPIRE